MSAFPAIVRVADVLAPIVRETDNHVEIARRPDDLAKGSVLRSKRAVLTFRAGCVRVTFPCGRQGVCQLSAFDKRLVRQGTTHARIDRCPVAAHRQ